MTIRRQYSLPNCMLVLEGLSDDITATNSPMDGRPLMSILVNAECHFIGSNKILSGGRVFFENLVRAVSAYAQEFLSGLRHPQELKEGSDVVHLEKIKAQNLHRLTWESKSDSEQKTLQIDLTTVQLFDLVDGVDQFLADSRTLPDLSLQLQPVSSRYRQAEESLAKRSAPAALGISSLAFAAIAFFFIPIPEVQKPASTNSQETNSEQIESTELNPSDISPEELQTLLSSKEEITDSTELYFLQRHLYKTIKQAGQDKEPITQKLEYRLSVTKDGSVVDYEPLSGTPETAVELTPLKELPYLPINENLSNQEALAKFKVVFNRSVLQVSPWDGYQDDPTFGPEITETEQLQKLDEQLTKTLQEVWRGTLVAPNDLVYRVAVTENGVIADYEANNQAGLDYSDEVPLPQLLQPEAAGVNPDKSLVPQKPLAQFKVVFKTNGNLEISPWR